MKLIAYILSFYMLFLIFVPCVDKDTNVKCSTYELSSQKQNPTEKDHSDHCSPLCVCSCCTSAFDITKYFPQIENYSVPVKLNPSLIIQFVSSNFSSIWQPPKF